jgi:hypothetical protein
MTVGCPASGGLDQLRQLVAGLFDAFMCFSPVRTLSFAERSLT